MFFFGVFGENAVIVYFIVHCRHLLAWFLFTTKVDMSALVPIPAGSALERADNSAAA